MKSPIQQQIQGNWTQFQGLLKETWGELSDDDLTKLEGQLDQLDGQISEMTGENRAAVRAKINQIADKVASAV